MRLCVPLCAPRPRARRYGATDKPTELYAIIEHFCNGRRRLELFGEDTNIRRGWLTLGNALSSSNHDPQAWAAHFEGTVASYNFDDEEPEMLPNHLRLLVMPEDLLCLKLHKSNPQVRRRV